MLNLLGAQPRRNRGLDLLISPQAILIQQMLVERANQDKEAIASVLESPDEALKTRPLQRGGQIDPRIVLFRNTALVPWLG